MKCTELKEMVIRPALMLDMKGFRHSVTLVKDSWRWKAKYQSIGTWQHNIL